MKKLYSQLASRMVRFEVAARWNQLDKLVIIYYLPFISWLLIAPMCCQRLLNFLRFRATHPVAIFCGRRGSPPVWLTFAWLWRNIIHAEQQGSFIMPVYQPISACMRMSSVWLILAECPVLKLLESDCMHRQIIDNFDLYYSFKKCYLNSSNSSSKSWFIIPWSSPSNPY